METIQKYPKDLKKGDIVLFYGYKFLVTENAHNWGQREDVYSYYEIKNDEKDCWSAPCVCLEKDKLQKDPLLRDYDGFQSNSTSIECLLTVLK
jgi:hypothetical protein